MAKLIVLNGEVIRVPVNPEHPALTLNRIGAAVAANSEAKK